MVAFGHATAVAFPLHYMYCLQAPRRNVASCNTQQSGSSWLGLVRRQLYNSITSAANILNKGSLDLQGSTPLMAALLLLSRLPGHCSEIHRLIRHLVRYSGRRTDQFSTTPHIFQRADALVSTRTGALVCTVHENGRHVRQCSYLWTPCIGAALCSLPLAAAPRRQLSPY